MGSGAFDHRGSFHVRAVMMPHPCRGLVALLLAAMAVAPAGEPVAPAGEPVAPPADLATAVDAIVEREAVGPVAAPCGDSDFIRRVHLDLVGTIPAAEQVRGFLADTATDKRSRLVDELLASPAFARQMALVLDALLLERKGAGAEAATWREALATALAADRPLDELCAEVIGSDGADAATRPAVTFHLTREVDPLRLTRSIGRVFLGRDLECCQCHDHPDNADLRQADYHGLRAFLQRSSLFKPPKDQPALVGETADGEVDYTSVFTKESAKGVRPRVPAGLTLLDEPLPEPGDAYVTAPAKEVRAVPVHSRRKALARMLVESGEFPRVLANRLWALVFGRGLVHPLDGHDPDNPPVHPDLLDLLAGHLRDGGFRIRPLLRGLVLSRTYGRAIEPPPLTAAVRAELPSLVERLVGERAAADAAVAPLAAQRDAAAARWQALLDADTAALAAVTPLVEPRDKARIAADAAAAATRAATDDVAKKAGQGEALGQAATQAAAAAALLPDDKVLAGATAIITARAAEFAPVIEAAKATLATRTKEEETARGALTAAREAVAVAAAKRPAMSDLAAADREAVTAREAWQAAVAAVARIDSRLRLARDILHHGQLPPGDPATRLLEESIDQQRTTLGQVARLRPLSPEQFALSLVTATGGMAAARTAAAAKIDKEPPARLSAAPPEAAAAVRALLVELGAVEQKAGLLGTVAGLYGDPLAGEFQASVNQALWLGNGPDLTAQLQATGGTLVERLAALTDDAAVADELFIGVLSRPPDAAEAADVVGLLAGRATDRAAAVAEVAWALLASVEFRFNH